MLLPNSRDNDNHTAVHPTRSPWRFISAGSRYSSNCATKLVLTNRRSTINQSCIRISVESILGIIQIWCLLFNKCYACYKRTQMEIATADVGIPLHQWTLVQWVIAKCIGRFGLKILHKFLKGTSVFRSQGAFTK